MEKEVMSEKSPLFGRRTNQIFLKPFDYLESAQFVPHYTNEENSKYQLSENQLDKLILIYKSIIYGFTMRYCRFTKYR